MLYGINCYIRFIGGVKLISGKIITANSGDDTITIVDRLPPFNKEIINLKSILLSNEKYMETKRDITIGPYDLIIDSYGKLLVVNSFDDSLFRIDLNTHKVIGIVNLGRCPVSIKLLDDKIIVINCDSNSITILNEKDLELIENFHIGCKPTDLDINKKDKKIYITNSEGYSVSIIDPDSGEIEEIKLDSQPVKIVIEGDYIYILSYIYNGTTNYSKLIAIGTKDYKIIWSFKLKGVYYDFIKVWNKLYFYLINPEDTYLYGLNPMEEKENKKIYLGGLPNKIMIDKNDIYINDLLNDLIIIIDTKKYEIVQKIKVGKEPQGILLL